MSKTKSDQRRRDPRVFLPVLVVPLVLALTLATFAWPSARLEPRDLPIGVAGPVAAADAVEQRLTAHAGEGAFDVHRYADEAAAREAIEDREVEGAVVATRGGAKLLTASASSPLVAGMLTSALSEPQTVASGHTQSVDVVPADEDDPRGAVLNSLVLPLVLTSVILAVMLTGLGRAGLMQVGALLATATVAGLVGIAMVQGWLGALDGNWVVNAGVLGLTMLAIASFIGGLAAWLGHPGLGLGALLMVLVGNPWSGISSSPHLLPESVGLTGQLLPPGAGGNLLKSTSFFDGAGSAGYLTVLLAWTVLGLALIAGAAVRNRRRATVAPALVEPKVDLGRAA
jgi:hypothetical protein